MIYDPRIWRKNYDPGVPAEFDIEDRSLIRYLEEAILPNMDRPAMNYLGVNMSYRKVMSHADRFARGLYEKGLGKGDVVALNMPNIPQNLFALLGSLKAGCTVSGLSPLFMPDEMEYQLNDCGAKALVTLDVMFSERLVKVQDNLPDLKYVFTANVADYLPKLKQVIGKLLKKIPSGRIEPIKGKEVTYFIDFCRSYPPDPPKIGNRGEDDCFIQYTGGTTGPPKGAVLTNANIISIMASVGRWIGLEPGKERNLTPFPMFHAAGLILNCLTTLSRAGEQTMIPNPRDVKHLIKEWDALKPTWGVIAPSLFTMLMNEKAFQRLDFSMTKALFSGSAPFSPEAMKTANRLIGGEKVAEGLGMTETSAVISANPVKGLKKIGSVGLPFPSTLVRIVDIETGTEDMPLGETGEIIAHGPQVMKCYHNKPEETENTLREHDGKIYIHTGDVGYMDEDGYIFVVDRVKDMIIVGGFKVFSSEVESKLYKHPAILFCALIGVPNPKRPGSELVKLVVQKSEAYASKPDERVKEELLNFAREKLAPYKVPKIIEIVDALPMTSVGKVDKKEIRKRG